MKNFESPENLRMPIEVSFSMDREIFRVKNTVKKYKWYIENGYKPSLPTDIENKLEKGEEVSNEDIESSVKKEYEEEKYKVEANKITNALENESPAFIEKLKSLGRPMPDKFYIFLTTYGVAGSYGYPDKITLNINKISKIGAISIIFHEMVHLLTEDLIKKYNVQHWTKERLINLTMNRFFPDKPTLQRDPENAEQISNIFEREFPNIEKIIEEVSGLQQLNGK